jgi:hypothetical protein
MTAIKWASGISGNWSLASNWSSGTIPSFSDDVTIDASGSYTINVNNGAGVNSLVFNAPAATINIPSNELVSVLHGITLTGGTIDGPGTLFLADVSTITAGPPLTLGDGLTFQLNGASLSLSAPIDIGDAAGSTATIVNSGGTINLISDAAGIGVNPSGNGNIQNRGTLAKTGGTGISRVAASITSTSTLSVTTGVLELDGPTQFRGPGPSLSLPEAPNSR